MTPIVTTQLGDAEDAGVAAVGALLRAAAVPAVGPHVPQNRASMGRSRVLGVRVTGPEVAAAATVEAGALLLRPTRGGVGGDSSSNRDHRLTHLRWQGEEILDHVSSISFTSFLPSHCIGDLSSQNKLFSW